MNKKTSLPFYALEDTQWFVGNEPARGPWSMDACHGGPPTAVIARALEQAVTDKQLVRMSVDLLRPIPMSGFCVDTTVEKNGRMVATARAELTDRNGKVCAVANSLHILPRDTGILPTFEPEAPVLAGAIPGDFPILDTAHGHRAFGHFVEVAYPVGENNAPGPTTMWARTTHLLDGEEMSPFQRICPIADCGNGASRNAELTDFSFVNPDVVIAMHRPPQSEWIASVSHSLWQDNGIGLANAQLFDELGSIATVFQTLLLSQA